MDRFFRWKSHNRAQEDVSMRQPMNEKFTISISRRIEASRPEPRTITRRDIKG